MKKELRGLRGPAERAENDPLWGLRWLVWMYVGIGVALAAAAAVDKWS